MGGFFGAVFAFLLAVFVVVVIHELGHYSLARLFGFRVLRFSFGFGKMLFSRRDNNGTVWAFSLVPLGGYVKLLDLEEASRRGIDPAEAFENRPLGQRAAVMAAGPGANFALAFILYLGLTLQGETGIRPKIDKVYPGTPAARAGFEPGDTVLSVDGEPTPLWRHFGRELLLGVTDASTLAVAVSRDGIAEQERLLDLGDVSPSVLDRNLVREVGLHPDTSFITRKVELVVEDSPAHRGGMLVGDEIAAVAGAAVDNWEEVVRAIESRPGETVEFAVLRAGARVPLTISVADELVEGERTGKIGVRPELDAALLEERRATVAYGPLEAVARAADWTVGGLLVTARFIKFLLFGEVSTKNLAGPIRIANYASDSLFLGLVSFVGFLAAISISLGVVNLLPIPVLDGGHLLLYAVEFVRGEKPSKRALSFLFGIGGALVLAFMVFAVVNDLMRL